MDSQSCSLNILVSKNKEQMTNSDYDVNFEPVPDTVIVARPSGLK